jgi:nitroreductase
MKSVLERARRAPSGGNIQPWHALVLCGQPLERLTLSMEEIADRGLRSEPAQYPIYPAALASPYAERRQQVGEDMYARLGIPRDDKVARAAWFTNNFRFFGAPIAMLVHMPATMGSPQ